MRHPQQRGERKAAEERWEARRSQIVSRYARDDSERRFEAQRLREQSQTASQEDR